MAQFASDSFTDSDGTLLSAHGSSWTRHSTGSSPSSGIAITSNRARNTTAATDGAYYHSGSPASADYSVSADVYVVSTDNTNEANVLARVSTSAATWYMARLLNTGSTSANWQVYKRVAGTFTQLGSNVAQTIAASNSYSLRLECIGTAIKLYTLGSGSAAISVTDSAISAAGKAGIRMYRSAGTITDGFHLDNFSGDDPASGSYTITAAHGSYTLSGQAVALKADRKITAAQGSFTLTGQAVRLARGYTLAVGQGSYTLNGQDVTLTYEPVGSYTLTADYGTYSLSGQAVNLTAARRITAAQGSYTLSGQAVGLARGFNLAAGQGTYTLTGRDVTLKATRAMTAAYGTYAITGYSVTLTLSGQAAPMTRRRRTVIEPVDRSTRVLKVSRKTII